VAFLRLSKWRPSGIGLSSIILDLNDISRTKISGLECGVIEHLPGGMSSSWIVKLTNSALLYILSGRNYWPERDVGGDVRLLVLFDPGWSHIDGMSRSRHQPCGKCCVRRLQLAIINLWTWMNHNNEDDFIHLQREERRGKISLCIPCVMIGSVVSGTLVVVTTLSNSDAMQTGNPHSNSITHHFLIHSAVIQTVHYITPCSSAGPIRTCIRYKLSLRRKILTRCYLFV